MIIRIPRTSHAEMKTVMHRARTIRDEEEAVSFSPQLPTVPVREEEDIASVCGLWCVWGVL